MRLILPCAGFGTRLDMPVDQSKELLLYNGKPLIEFSLELAKEFNLEPLVITRAEKKDLIEYCKVNNIETQIIVPEGEWANTVLMSELYWEEYNILVLPDTIFTNKDFLIPQIIKDLTVHDYNYAFCLHKVEDSSKWGIIKDDYLYEKPNFSENAWAWGLIGFKKQYGKELFLNCKKGNRLKLIKFSGIVISSFEDLTRDKKYNLTRTKE